MLPLHFAIDRELINYAAEFVKVMSKEEIGIPDGFGMTAMEYAEVLENK